MTTFVADVVLTERDRRPDPVTRWWRVLEPCPVCNEKMKLHGDEPGLLLGCTGHGFWIDADTIEHTGLARPVDAAALERKREDAAAIAADRENRERAEQQRAEDKLTRQRAEAGVRQLKPRRASTPVAETAPSRSELESAFLDTLDPVMRRLWQRVMALERRNTELEERVAALER